MRTPCSSLKVAWHEERLRAYLAGTPILPVTVELDITTACDAGCHGCPSTRAGEGLSLGLPRLERLFGGLEGETRGLLLSGGEPTQSADFPATLALARRRGFRDVAVVSNGSRLHEPAVQEALVRHASAVRVSIYGWTPSGPDERLARVLAGVGALRRRVAEAGSELQIGMSFLTSADIAGGLALVARTVRDAGAHWLYLHPRCTGWSTGDLGLEEQAGVAREAEGLAHRWPDFAVHHGAERYAPGELSFGAYHTSHFLLVVGADGTVYLGTETKYQPAYAVGEIGLDWTPARLQEPRRLRAIAGASSRAYRGAGGRHRGILYADVIETLVRDPVGRDAVFARARSFDPLFPHVL